MCIFWECKGEYFWVDAFDKKGKWQFSGEIPGTDLDEVKFQVRLMCYQRDCELVLFEPVENLHPKLRERIGIFY